MNLLVFSNGVNIDATQIVKVESNQQTILFPGAIGELQHLFDGQPSSLLVHLRDGSSVEIKAGNTHLGMRRDEPPS